MTIEKQKKAVIMADNIITTFGFFDKKTIVFCGLIEGIGNPTCATSYKTIEKMYNKFMSEVEG